MNSKIINVKTLVVLSIAIATLFVSISFLQEEKVDAQNLETNAIPKAAIIDQLSEEIKNDYFTQVGVSYLEIAGYSVDVYTTNDVTIDLFKRLPEMGYKIVIVRTHGTADTNNQKSLLFTGERYSEDKYPSEQLLGQVERATPVLELTYEPDYEREWTVFNDTYRILKSPAKVTDNTQDEYFAIGSKFVDEQMRGKFPDTIFLLGGCNTGKNPSLAESLIARGASYVVGWDDTVGAYENDAVMLEIISTAFINKGDFAQTVESVRDQYNQYEHPFDGKLVYFS
jgi:hypothetical protein